MLVNAAFGAVKAPEEQVGVFVVCVHSAPFLGCPLPLADVTLLSVSLTAFARDVMEGTPSSFRASTQALTRFAKMPQRDLFKVRSHG